MDEQQPPEQPNQDADGSPKIFKNINGWIAGITGLVVALGGLATAYKQLFPERKTEAATSAAALAEGTQRAAAADIAAKPDEDLPLLYEGDDVKLEFVGDQWVLTDKDGEYHYEDMYSPDETRVLAFDKQNNAYLRWPIKGGMSEEGSADKQSWTNYVDLYPPEPAKGGAAGQ